MQIFFTSSVVDPNPFDADAAHRIRIGNNGSGSADLHHERTDPDPLLVNNFCEFYFSKEGISDLRI